MASDAGTDGPALTDAAPANDATAPDVTPPVPSCIAYCDAVLACNDAYHVEYPDPTVCMRVCATFAKGTYGDDGDTLGCRLAHAIAARSNPDVECVIAGPTGGGVCGTRCDSFCKLAAVACGGAWTDGAACAATCAGWPAIDGGPIQEYSGATLDCRETRLRGAFEVDDASPACADIGPDGGDCR